METLSIGLPSNSITSFQLLEQINIFRKEDDKSEIGHNDLMKVIRDEFEEEIGMGKFSHTPYIHPQNKQTYYMYELTLSQAKQVLTRESKKVRKAVIAYIEKLESAFPNFTDPAEAAEAWAKEYRAKQKALEEKKQLELKVQEDAPKVEFFDDLVDRKLNLNFRTTAKEIGVKESAFIQYLLDKKYIYRGSGNKLLPYAQHVGEDKLFVIKEQKTEKWAGTQTLITPKGRARFLILLGDKGQHLLN